MAKKQSEAVSGGQVGTDFVLSLRPEPSRPDGPTVEQRMRQLLKIAKRSFGFSCIRIGPDIPAELPPVEPSQDYRRLTSIESSRSSSSL